MAIDTSGKWWVGDKPEDIEQYLGSFTEDSYPTDKFRLSHCDCGCVVFRVSADGDEGCAKRVCSKCKKERFICDSEEYWEDAEPELWECSECNSKETNIGVGFSLYDGGKDIRWIYIGVRCSKCGILGCFVDWKVGYGPSLHLLDQA